MTSAGQIAVGDLEVMLSTLAGIDFKKVYADFQAGDAELEIGDALLIAQVVAGDVGYFVPEAATAAQWIGLARALMPVIVPAVRYADAHLPPPHKLQPNEIEAWGHAFTR